MNTKDIRVVNMHNTLKLHLLYNALPILEPKNLMNVVLLKVEPMLIVKVQMEKIQRFVLLPQHLVVVVMQLMLVYFKKVKINLVLNPKQIV